MKFGKTSRSAQRSPQSPVQQSRLPASASAPAHAHAHASAHTPAVLDPADDEEIEEIDDVDLEEPEIENVASPVAAVPPVAPNELAERVAREAVERVLSDQAEARMFDVVDTDRVVLTLQLDDLAVLKSQWTARNSAGIGRITFSEFLSLRLRACRLHTAVRAIYVRDETRQQIESLFDAVVMSDTDLVNKLDRHIRPIIECPEGTAGIENGVLKLKPVDPRLLEMVTGWYPDRTPAEALGDFMTEAALEKAGLI